MVFLFDFLVCSFWLKLKLPVLLLLFLLVLPSFLVLLCFCHIKQTDGKWAMLLLWNTHRNTPTNVQKRTPGWKQEIVDEEVVDTEVESREARFDLGERKVHAKIWRLL